MRICVRSRHRLRGLSALTLLLAASAPSHAQDAAPPVNARERAQVSAPVRTGRPLAKSRGAPQPSLFDALVQADSLEQATGIDLTGNGQ